MFLANRPNLLPIFQAYHANGPEVWSRWGVHSLSDNRHARKIACWFHDAQYTIDHEDFENTQLFLVCLSDRIYQKEIVWQGMDGEDEIQKEVRMVTAWRREEFEKAFYAVPRHQPLTKEEWEEYKTGIEDVERNAKESVNQRNLSEVKKTYNSTLNDLNQIACECDTLSMAKEQMKAFERQQQKNAYPVPLHYQISDLLEPTLDALYDLKEKYSNFFNKWDKDEFMEECKRLWEACKKQPISLVLLPTLLTILIVEGIGYKNVYAYLKQTNRYISAANMKKIAQLFEDICEILELGDAQVSESQSRQSCRNWWIPVFNWQEIEKKFYAHNGLSDEEQKIAHSYFAKLRYKNGLSKAEERELAQVSYGAKLQALAKICNLNCFMMLTLQVPEKMEPGSLNSKEIVIPAKAKSAYKLLLADQILPRAESAPRIFGSYFEGLYTSVYGIPEFSYIALLRHYRLPVDQIDRCMPLGLKKLAHAFSSQTSGYVQRITATFKRQQNSFPIYDNLESKKEKEACGTMIGLKPFGESNFRTDYIRNSYRLSSQIADRYSEEDYREFIGDIHHFENPGFGKYLACFCKKQGISLYPSELDHENVFLENAAFSTIMELIQCYLEKNFYSYWMHHISNEFGLYDDTPNLRT